MVQKVLRSLPIRFNPKVSAIEEKKHLEKLTMDTLWGILIAYETRIEDPKQTKVSFKASQKSHQSKKKYYSPSTVLDDESDEDISNFVNKPKKGTGKYKGNLPLKCFRCGKIGHFAAKCPLIHYGEFNPKQN